MRTKVTELLKIELPIIQGGMVWVSGWKLASAVSNEGGLGLIGAGSMKSELLREHIRKCAAATGKPFGVNIPLLRQDVQDLIDVVIEEKIKIVFTSAGHPGKYIDQFKKNDIKVVHVVSNVKQGIKAESVGCDAVVGEGVEAGGHNGKDELSTISLIPQLVDSLKIPVIAAGGIANGRGIIAVLALGAEGVQIGTRFAATIESSAHENYKRMIAESSDSDTVLILKNISLARVIKNSFSELAMQVESEGNMDRLRQLMEVKRERLGIFEGDVNEGMMEAGQSAGLIKQIVSVREVFRDFKNEMEIARKRICGLVG